MQYTELGCTGLQTSVVGIRLEHLQRQPRATLEMTVFDGMEYGPDMRRERRPSTRCYPAWMWLGDKPAMDLITRYSTRVASRVQRICPQACSG